MELKKDPIICMEPQCLQIPIFSSDYKKEVHFSHAQKIMKQSDLDEYIQQEILSGHPDKLMKCYLKLYEYNLIVNQMSKAVYGIKMQMDRSIIENCLPLYRQIFQPLKSLEYKREYNLSDIQEAQRLISVWDYGGEGQHKLCVEDNINFNFPRQQYKQFFKKVDQTIEMLKVKCIFLKRKKKQLIDRLLQVNPKIQDLQLKVEEVGNDKTPLLGQNSKIQNSNEIQEIYATLQMYQNQKLKQKGQTQEKLKPGEDSKKNDQNIIDLIDQKKNQNGNIEKNKTQEVFDKIDQKKLVFTGLNRFFIKRTEEEKINILCQAIQSKYLSEICQKYLISQDTLKYWRGKYLNQCLDILQSQNIFFARRPGWERESKSLNQASHQQKIKQFK